MAGRSTSSPEPATPSGRSGDDRCLAVDGVGILILALLRLEDGADRQLLGFSW
jgi:hypothetical protein